MGEQGNTGEGEGNIFHISFLISHFSFEFSQHIGFANCMVKWTRHRTVLYLATLASDEMKNEK